MSKLQGLREKIYDTTHKKISTGSPSSDFKRQARAQTRWSGDFNNDIHNNKIRLSQYFGISQLGNPLFRHPSGSRRPVSSKIFLSEKYLPVRLGRPWLFAKFHIR
jgi:hypothetical protein